MSKVGKWETSSFKTNKNVISLNKYRKTFGSFNYFLYLCDVIKKEIISMSERNKEHE